MVIRAVTVNDILDGHVGLDLECFDWIYLNGWVPNLQVSGRRRLPAPEHRVPIPSSAILKKIGLRFRRAVEEFAAANDIAVIRSVKGERRPRVAVFREFQRVFTGPPTTAMSMAGRFPVA